MPKPIPATARCPICRKRGIPIVDGKWAPHNYAHRGGVLCAKSGKPY